jgi:hypothetical protein
MSKKIRVWFLPNGDVKCVNASHGERVFVMAPKWSDFVEVRPGSCFEGDFQKRKVEAIAPTVLTADIVQYPSGVRRATEEDIDELYLMVPQLLAESTLLPVSAQKVEKLIERCAMRQGGAIAGIIDGPDGIDASIGLDVVESDVSDHRYVRAIWLGLHPNLRSAPPPQRDPRSNHGRRLFDFAKWYHGMLEQQAGHPVLMQFDVATKAGLGPKLGFYERNVTPVGATFAYLSGAALLARDEEAA